MNMDHLKYIGIVSEQDIAHVEMKEKTYQGSWKKRGGVGAFMMMARKWDRLEGILGKRDYDIFETIHDAPGGEDGTVLAEVRDLRRYLLLIEAEMVARGDVRQEQTTKPERKMGFVVDTARNSTVKEISPHFDSVKMDGVVYGTDRPGTSPEMNRPGTPEDGGHHARDEVFPWIAKQKWLESSVTPEQWRTYWHRLGQSDEFVLETTVQSGVTTPAELEDLYRVTGKLRILRMSRVPESYRSLFPTVRRELNANEHDSMPEWQREMYRWTESGNKYVLMPDFEAWAREQ